MNNILDKIKELDDKYKLLSKNEDSFENQKKIVDILNEISMNIDIIYDNNKLKKTNNLYKLQYLCTSHEWIKDTSMWDGHTSKYCIKCDKYIP